MKKITAYKLDDGSIIENEVEAIALENRIEAIKDLNKLLGKQDYGMSSAMISNFIVENREVLKDIISRM